MSAIGVMSAIGLADGFEPQDRAAWRGLAEKALRGEDIESALVSRTLDGLEIAPLYARDDRPNIALQIPLPDLGNGHSPWEIRQRFAEARPADANRAVLEDLEAGVGGIVLQIAAPGRFGIRVESAADLARALDGVRLDIAPIAIDAGVRAQEIAGWLVAHLTAAGESARRAQLFLGLDPLGELARMGTLPGALTQSLTRMAERAGDIAGRFPDARPVRVDALPYHEAGASEAEELAALAATLVVYLRAMDDAGIDPGRALAATAFRLAADTDLFATIARMRAARIIIRRIAEACGTDNPARPIHLTAETAGRMLTRRDPWVNMLRITIAVTGAALGGADAITALPFTWAIGAPDRLARRNARNIQIMLQEESGLGRVREPAAGSYYIDHLTDGLARKAWALFQEIEAGGGMAEALAAGRIQAMIKATREARGRRIATLADPLTGVSTFANLDEKPVEAAPHPAAFPIEAGAIRIEPMPATRLAAAFENLRDASDAHLGVHGARPKVFLVPLGRLADFASRIRLARNLLAAGGIESVSVEVGFTEPQAAGEAFAASGCQIACLCGSDRLYETSGPVTVMALVDAGACAVPVAGRPASPEVGALLEGAGASCFLDEGENVLGALRSIHDLIARAARGAS